MRLIVGLGNPGVKYERTRHNVGFFVIDYLVTKNDLKEKSEHKSLTYKWKVKDQDVLLVKPQTYMNLSGEAVQSLMAFYKIPLTNLLVIHDDIDQNFLSVKFQTNSSSGGQNGINSIHQVLGTQDYARLKMGVGRPHFPGQSAADHVLQPFNDTENLFIPSWVRFCADAVEYFILNEIHKASSIYNIKIPHFKELVEKDLLDLTPADDKFLKLKTALKGKK